VRFRGRLKQVLDALRNGGPSEWQTRTLLLSYCD